MSDKMRLRFSKTGRAVYISHLDLMQTMQRAFSRAGFPLKYSEGYNPHPLISIALPLSVGAASECELMDFRLAGDEIAPALAEKLTAALPEGVRVLEVYEPQRKTVELKWLRMEGRFDYDRGVDESLLDDLRAFYAQESIVITKKTKRGMGEVDIRPAIGSLSLTAESDAVRLEGLISAQEPTLNPELLAEALRQLRPELAPDFAKFTRLETLDADFEIFR